MVGCECLTNTCTQSLVNWQCFTTSTTLSILAICILTDLCMNSPLPITTSQLIERSFTRSIKEQCWKRAQCVPGRHPDRWRIDVLGNIVCKRLIGCPGAVCYEFDHVVPFSRGGPSSLSNCQILQTRANRKKGNLFDDEIIMEQERQHTYSTQQLDTIELAIWGNILRV